jgi:hypothetical protein
VAICCGLKEGSLAKSPQHGSANQGGIFFASTAWRMAWANGRVFS